MKKLKIVMFIGPSGSGKSTCVETLTKSSFKPILESHMSRYFRMEQYTTRERRDDEIEQSPYTFVSDSEFKEHRNCNNIFEARSYDMINKSNETVTVHYGSSLCKTIDSIDTYNEANDTTINKDNYYIAAECTLEMAFSYIDLVRTVLSGNQKSLVGYDIELVPVVIKNKDSCRLRKIMDRDCKYDDKALDETIRRFVQDKSDFSERKFTEMYDEIKALNYYILDKCRTKAGVQLKNTCHIVYPRVLNIDYRSSMDNLLTLINNII